jgi:hypothetical protein
VIVAIYVQSISKVLPVSPVSRIERLTPHDRRQNRPRQEQPASFEALLASMMQAADTEETTGFSAYA